LRPTTSPHGIHCECVSAAGAQCSAAQCPCLILQRATAVTVTRPWPLKWIQYQVLRASFSMGLRPWM
ncbi:unnamed protein product, partial [Arabidopsis thaliana]